MTIYERSTLDERCRVVARTEKLRLGRGRSVPLGITREALDISQTRLDTIDLYHSVSHLGWLRFFSGKDLTR